LAWEEWVNDAYLRLSTLFTEWGRGTKFFIYFDNIPMKITSQKQWTLAAIIGLAHWFFGNLYEAIVISPNWIVDSPMQLQRLNEFFVNTSPTLYFVPITQIATIAVWVLTFLNKENSVKKDYKMASIVTVLITALNAFIVSTIILKLFGSDYAQYGEYLHTLSWRWNILNFFRMILTFTVIYYLFSIYRKLDKLEKS
jgi:hypothetical protein